MTSRSYASPGLHATTRAVAAFHLLAALARGAPNYNVPLDRPYTLRNAVPLSLEMENHRQIDSRKPRSYIFPRACVSEADSSKVCGETSRFHFIDSDRDRNLFGRPVLGYGYRYLSENVHGGEGGGSLWGNSGPLSFYLDARMYAESHEKAAQPSYDREYVERQDEGDSHGIAYTSFSRYRANLSYDWSWGRLTVARDGAHWGPGSFGNLVFNREAVPFNQATFRARIGPLSVISLYGQLTTAGPGEFFSETPNRSVYAHRYELSPSAAWTFGISEQLIIFDRETPFAFVPIVPLYIAKAYSGESHNNGNIAADISFVMPEVLNLYGEFLVDDLKSPSGLFDDTWSNKWAILIGTHFIKDFGAAKSGVVAEFSRVEPWVYTHYFPKTAQAANQGVSLGNPSGPNSMSVQCMLYVALDHYHLSLKSMVDWKGKDRGSAISDTIYEFSDARKNFLVEASPHFHLRPAANFTNSSGSLSVSLEGDASGSLSGFVQFRY